MSYDPRTKRVWKAPETIESLEHGFEWATDEEINERLLARYRDYNYLTPSDTANENMFQDVIYTWHEYIDRLYATTLFEYDPLLNYDLHEEGSVIDEKHKGSKASTNTDVTTTETPRVERVTEETGYGYDSDANGSPVGKTTEHAPSGTNETRVQGTGANNVTKFEDIDATHFDKDVRTFDEYHKYGQIGTTKTQDLIEAERKLIVSVLTIYVDKFKKCFDISSYINREPFEEVE